MNAFDKWYFYDEVQNYHSQVHNCFREKSHAIWNKCEIFYNTKVAIKSTCWYRSTFVLTITVPSYIVFCNLGGKIVVT